MGFLLELNYSSILFWSAIILTLNCLLILSRIKIDSIIFANVFLMFIAIFEPAPSDVLFISLLIFAVKDRVITEKKYLKMSLVIWLMISYLLICTLSILNIKDYYMGFRFFAVTLYLVIYSFIIYFYSNEKNYISTLRAYIAGSTTAALLGVMGYAGILSKYLAFDEYRSKGLFKDPNVFGPFLIPAVLILLGDIKSGEILFNKNKGKFASRNIIIYLALITLNLIGIIISFSRGAWASLAVSMLIYLLLNIRKINPKRLAVIGLAIVSIFTIIWFGILSSESKGFFVSRLSLREYDNQRFEAQKAGLSLSLDHFFGYGPGQYENAVSKVIGVKYSAHSLYIRVLLENGIIGLFLLAAPSLYIILRLIQVRNKGDTDAKMKSSVLISILAALMVNSLVVDTLHWRHLWLFYGFAMSFVSNFHFNESLKLPLDKHETEEV